jgi:MoaA/NifB/PqqE/SkfB family radical SAM enzyme
MATFYQKTKLLKGLITGDIARTGPFYVTVDVTRRCNLRCSGCRYHSPYMNFPSPTDQTIHDISFYQFKKLCEELKTMGTNSIVLMGEGEPFLHPRLFDMISVAKGIKNKVIMFTNGTFLDESRIQSLIDSRLDILMVSLWASSSEAYKLNYPGTSPDNFVKTVNGLKLLSRFKTEQKSKIPFVVLHHPINHHNFQKIDELIDLALNTGCNAISFSAFFPSQGELTSLALSPEEEKFVFLSLNNAKNRLNSLSINHNINYILLRYRIGEAVWNKLPCYIAWIHAQIKVDGTVFPCCRCDLPLGNLKENSFHKIWNGSAYRIFRRKMLTRKGLTSVGRHCNCSFCSFVGDNMRVHRLFKWISPIVNRLKE